MSEASSAGALNTE